MKPLGYCLLCLLVASEAQPKPQLTKLLPVEGRLNDTVTSLDRFLEKLRATYDFVFRQFDNISNVEANINSLKLIRTDSPKANGSTNLKYPDSSWWDQIMSLSTLKKRRYQARKASSNLDRASTEEVRSTIKANESNANETSLPDNTRTPTSDDDRFEDAQLLGHLELQDDKNDVEIATPGTTLQFPIVSRHLTEWLGSLLGLTYRIYTKLSGATCSNDNENAIK